MGKKVEINDLIALCYMIDEFDEFHERLLYFISTENIVDVVNFAEQLHKVSKGKILFCMKVKKIERFYQENQKVIDIINKYSGIAWFIKKNYTNQGLLCESRLNMFYQYILQNKDSINQILKILEQLKKLGFQKIELDENLDFKNTEYTMNVNMNSNSTITYLDNLEGIPNYEYDIVRYKSTGSSYKMMLNVLWNEFSNCRCSIVVNSLLFDCERLPISISKEQIFDKIVKIKMEQKKTDSAVRDLVNLSVCFNDLSTSLQTTNRVVNGLSNVKSKEELLQVLSTMKENLTQLSTVYDEYQNALLEENPSLTSEGVKIEKRKYLSIRDSFGIDKC